MLDNEKVKYFKCEICGNIIQEVCDSGRTVSCCGREMRQLYPNITDGDKEKHVPFLSLHGDLVRIQIGKLAHPMEKEHYIQWIDLVTNLGIHRRVLSPESLPLAEFVLTDNEKIESIYAYCNIHGLWKKDIV